MRIPRIRAAVLCACLLLLLTLHPLPLPTLPTLPPLASSHQLLRALGWSLLSGLATGVGGAVVFCLDDTHDDEAAVSARVLAFLLGLAVGVMVVLSLLDMLVPKLLLYGLQPLPLAAIAAGVATIYALDSLIDRLGLQPEFLGHGHGHAHEHIPSIGAPPLSPPHLKAEVARERARAKAASARSALLTTLALAAHNAPEGLAVGMASLQGDAEPAAGEEAGAADRHTALFVFAIVRPHPPPA